MLIRLKQLARCALATVLLLLPVPEFSALADTSPAATTAPRFALVIGNGKYREQQNREFEHRTRTPRFGKIAASTTGAGYSATSLSNNVWPVNGFLRGGTLTIAGASPDNNVMHG